MQIHPFRSRVPDALRGDDRARFLADLGAGATMGVVALPLAMAFAMVFAMASGVKPEQSLFTAVIAGFIIAALGGSQVQTGGPAGACIGWLFLWPHVFKTVGLREFSWKMAKQLPIPTLTIAMLGAIESLLCARVADNLIDFPRHDPNQELMAQGVASFVVPLAVLAGVLMFVAWNMGEWHEFVRLRHFSAQYRTILLGTFALTVVFDLAVEVGLGLACVFFIYRMIRRSGLEAAIGDDHIVRNLDAMAAPR